MPAIKKVIKKAALLKYEMTIVIFMVVKMSWPYAGKTIALSNYFLFCVTAALIIFIAWCSGKIINCSANETKNAVIVFISFFFVSYVSNSVLYIDLWHTDFYVIKNTVIIILTLLSLILIDKPEWKWQVPVFCFICTWIMPLYTLTLMPVILTLIIFNTVMNKTVSDNKVLWIACALASAAAFLIFGAKTFFTQIFSISNLGVAGLQLLAISAGLVLPLLILFPVFWREVTKNSISGVRKIIVLIAVQPVISVISVFLTQTHMNLIMFTVFAQFCFLCYLIYKKNNAVVLTLEKVDRIIKKNWHLVMIIIVYLACFSGFAKGYGKLSGLDALWL